MTIDPAPVRLADVSVFFHGRAVFSSISKEIAPNRITVLTGPSGCGKSTLLRSLCRMNDRLPGFSIAGVLEVLGQPLYEGSCDVTALRSQVGLLFQRPCMFPGSILENTAFGLRYRKPHLQQEFADRVETALRRVGLWKEIQSRLHQPAATLSVGQQQRLAIARALVLDPEILLLDEPTSALDPRSTRAFEELAVSLKEAHTLLWVTHHPEQARRVGDDHWEMRAAGAPL